MNSIEPNFMIFITIPDVGAAKTEVNIEGYLKFFQYFMKTII